MISKENNLGNREKTQKGYYEFKTEYAYNTKAHTITIKQRGYKINEQSGKRVSINKIKKLNFDSYSLQFKLIERIKMGRTAHFMELNISGFLHQFIQSFNLENDAKFQFH